MSEIQIILQLTRIEKMLTQVTFLNREVLTSKEAALYLGLSRDYFGTFAKRNRIPSFRPTNGKRFYFRKNLQRWMLSSGRVNSSPITEAEKMAIHHPERS